MDRLLRGTAAQITVTVTAAGEPVQADAPPSVLVARENGETLIVGTSWAGEGVGVYVLTLSAEQTGAVDVLEAKWSATIAGTTSFFFTTHEVVGGFLASVEAIEDSLPTMSPRPTRPEIEEARTLAEDWLEDTCGVAFRPRYARDVLDGSGTERLLLSHPQVLAVRSSSVDSVDVSGTRVASSGELWQESTWGEGFQNVEVVYEHGYPTVPSEVSRAAVLLARLFLVPDPSDYDGRASSISTETAHYTLITPGMRGAITAIPEVDIVMRMFDFAGIV